MLWDRGTWEPHPGKDPAKTIREGHLHFTLDGERMKGEWVMFRMKPRGKERNENWILKKVKDEFAGSSTGLTDTYLTIGRRPGGRWTRSRRGKLLPGTGRGTAARSGVVEGARNEALGPLHRAPRGPPPRPGEEPNSPSSANPKKPRSSITCPPAPAGCTR